MIGPLAKLIDWSALQMAYVVAGLKHAPKPKWKLEEALEFLNGPDFIPAASEPARIEFDGPRHFKFPTPRPGQVEENNVVYGRLYRCAERWQERPVIILLDGNPAIGYHSAFPLFARRFNRAGFNVAPLVAPYHLPMISCIVPASCYEDFHHCASIQRGTIPGENPRANQGGGGRFGKHRLGKCSYLV